MSVRVIVAMSGGVDSSVAASLLKSNGCEVIGVFMRMGEIAGGARGPRRPCCSLESAEDARAVARKLDIRFYVMNYRDDFRALVEDFMDEYGRGRTPNPCVLCNSRLKFGKMMDFARAMEAGFVATGHYARVERAASGRFLLRKAVDLSKDQSYALFCLNQEQLSRVLFPLGGIEKKETRRIARDLGLPVHQKAESQDICFVPDGDYPALIESLRPGSLKEGQIVTLDGRVVGRHRGYQCYTIGQRRGLRVAFGRPMYVVRIEAGSNRVVVGEDADLARSELIASNVNWICAAPSAPFKASVKLRYSHAGAPASVEPVSANRVRVVFDDSQRAVTPGQAAVFYDADVVLGGGWIE